MNRAQRTCEAIHITVMGVWCGVIVAMGAMAAVIFPEMKHLGPSLPAYASYPGDHWKLAAGQVMNRVFMIGDWVGAGAAAIGLVTWLVAAPAGRGRALTIVRGLAVVASAAISAASLGWLHREMGAELASYTSAAAAGDIAVAEAHRARFDEFHPVASGLMKAQLAAVLVAVIAAAAQITAAGRPAAEPEP